MEIQSSGPNLREYLVDHDPDHVTLIEPGGNHGDRIIYMGMEKLLNDLAIGFNKVNVYGRFETSHSNALIQVVRRAQRWLNTVGSQVSILPFKKIDLAEESDMVIINGGANINEFWIHGIYLLKHVVQICNDRSVVVAPQTYFFKNRTVERALPRDDDIHLFAREAYSYSLLNRERGLDHLSTYLSQDTALYLTREDLEPSIDHDLTPSEAYHLASFRQDKEAIISHSVADRIEEEAANLVSGDISKKAQYSFEEFVSLVNDADLVYTDRLHVAILGSILETPVEMYENIYYKNYGVYRQSLADDDGVTFHRIPDITE